MRGPSGSPVIASGAKQSPSRYALRWRLRARPGVASIQHYLVVRAARREVIHHRRAGADILTQVINLGSIALDPPGITIDLAEFYPSEPPG